MAGNGVRSLILSAIDRISGGALTPIQQHDIADAAIKIIEDQNKTVALRVMKTANEVLHDPAMNKPSDMDKGSG